MKRLLSLIVLAFTVILVSCFDFVGTGRSRQLLNVAIGAPGDVAMIYLGVYDSTISLGTELMRQTFNGLSQLDLHAPPGMNRIFLVYAQGYSGNANYYGVTPPVTILDEDEELPLVIQMHRFADASTFNAYNYGAHQTWNEIPGAIEYEVLSSGSTVGYTINNYYDYASIANPSVRISTSIFGIGSDMSPVF